MSIDRLRSLISDARNMVVLTGAGMSTESGIPDFRSPGGIWERYRIVEYREFMTSTEARLEDWRRRFEMEDQIGEVGPNRGHAVLADWVKTNKCATLITQNIDGLHQEAGVPTDKIIELHGTARHAVCTACGLRHEIADCRAMLETGGQPPSCVSCNGIVKSAVVMFGEAMPERQTEDAFLAAEQADLFLAIGTSLQVYPAAGLPEHAKRRGARLAIINREETPLDSYADVVVHGEIGETLSAIAADV